MKRKKVLLSTAGVFLAFVLVAWAAGALLQPEGAKLWILRGGILLLGLMAALLVYLYLALKARTNPAPAPAPAERDDDIDLAVAAARARLAASGVTGKARLSKLPVVLVVGPGGSTKTTTVAHSGLDPELLAGEVHRAEAVVPTAGINLWFAERTVFLEAGGKVVADASRWARLVRHLQPSRWAAVLSGGRQAPRVAVVCFGCDELLKPGSSEAVPAHAARLRARLLDVSVRLGIRLPVYVVFTKADRLPYFADYVRGLTRAEAGEVLGATLPAPAPADAGGYAERESGRLNRAFGGILRALALRRPEVLARETQEEVRAGAYEFPRELAKVAPLAVQFLLDLCKPSQLNVSPFLRGFYFSGVRPVIIRDPAAAPPAGAAAGRGALDATGVFDARQFQTARPAPNPVGGERKVPQWLFLNRLFREVILADRAAMAVTGGGTRVNLWRRLLAGGAAAFFVVLAVGFTVSYFANRALERDALAAARGVEAIDVTGAGLPGTDELRRLDALREQAARLRRFEQDGGPWRLGWWLYTGSTVRRELRRLYFDRFEPLLWQRTRAGLLAALRGMSDAPEQADAYGEAYDALKAHLVTTSHPQESTPEFLAPTLARYWPRAEDAAADPEREALVRRQFAFFGAELPYGKPYDDRPDPELVEGTRILLERFATVEPFYQAMVAAAGAEIEPVRFASRFPGSESVLRNDGMVPGAFTRAGWAAVQADLAQVDRLFARENWVVGERAVPPEDRAKLAQDLRTRYTADYIARWRAFLESASVAVYGGPADAARKLARLSGNQSPVLQMLALVGEHAAVDSATVTAAFAPVYAVVPAGATDRYVGDTNQTYMAALAALQSTLDQVAGAAGPARANALAQAAASAEKVTLEVRQLAQGFGIEGEARAVGRAVEHLLLAPVTRAESLLRGLPAAELNGKGAAFCRAFQGIADRYPFDASARAEATVEELTAVFQPGGSALWTFYEETLRDLLTPQGSRYAARVGVEPRPSAEFVAFFNRAAAISRAFYAEGGSGPQLVFALRPQTSAEIPEVTVTLDGQRQRYTRTFAAAKTFVWEGSDAGAARVAGSIDGAETVLLEAPPGPWAVFRLFRQAEWERLGDGRYLLRWRIPDRPLTLTAELDLAAGAPVFTDDFLGGLDCVPRITR